MWFIPISFFAIVCATPSVVDGGKILAILPTPSYSHQIVFACLLRELNRRGHEIVVVTPDPFDEKNGPDLFDEKNGTYKEISIREAYQFFDAIDFIKVHLETNWIDSIDSMWNVSYDTSHVIFRNPDVRKLYENGNVYGFDLLLVDYLMYPSIYAIGYKLGIPHVGISSLELFEYKQYLLGMPILPSHLSNWELQNGPGTNLPFIQRLKNFVRTWKFIYRNDRELIERHNEIARQYLGENTPDLREIIQNVSLIFTNCHAVFSTMKPKVSKVVDIGGILMSCKNHTQQMPNDLKKFVEDATEGFIYVSLGSNAKSSNLPDNIKNTFLKVFEKLPYKVLWKYEDDSLPNVPGNVFVSKWFPQAPVLGHPNIKLFVYQGGLQSTEGAISNAVPLVGIPILADQMTQVYRMVQLGVAKRLDVTDINEQSLFKVIQETVDDKRYKERMLKAQKIYKEMSEDRLNVTVWWTEFVMRHGGAPYLDFSVADEPWYIKYDLDVIFSLSVSIFMTACITLYLFIKIMMCLFNFHSNAIKMKSC